MWDRKTGTDEALPDAISRCRGTLERWSESKWIEDRGASMREEGASLSYLEIDYICPESVSPLLKMDAGKEDERGRETRSLACKLRPPISIDEIPPR